MKLQIPKIKAKKGQEKQAKTLNFLLRLIIWALPLYIILLFGLTWPPLQRVIADITLYLLNVAGFHPILNDLLISIPIRNGTWGAYISWDCTAWKSMLAFLALVMATDYSKRAKKLGLAVFLPLIFLVNIIRIFFMFYYVRTYDLANYDFVHAVVWSWGLIFTILIFWLLWLRWQRQA